MTDYTNVPESLYEWARLNERFDQLDADFDQAESEKDVVALKAIDAEIHLVCAQLKVAWEHAPWKDRQLMNWRMFKQVWHDRVLRPETGEKGTPS